MSFASGPPPPMPVGGPPPLPHHGGGPPRHNRPFQILLTHIPSFLHNNRSLRDWIISGGGSVRNVMFVPMPSRDASTNSGYVKKGGNSSNSSEGAGPTIDIGCIAALLAMSHADAAFKMIAAFRHFKKKLSAEGNGNEELLKFSAHAVPHHPDIPLPPAVMDPVTTQVLGDKLHQAFINFQHLEQDQENNRNGDDQGQNSSFRSKSGNNEDADQSFLDAQKAAAAAGGQYDPDEDPLNAPAVLEGVQSFRRNLEKLQGSKATRRKALVQSKLQQALPRIRELMKQEKQQRETQVLPPPLPTAFPPPPPPHGGPPLPPGGAPPPPPQPDGSDLPPPPLPPGKTLPPAPRGVSNLPAWMTQQQAGSVEEPPPPPPSQQQASEEPPSKRPKLDNDDDNNNISTDDFMSQTFPTLEPSLAATLRTFIASQVKQFLGEEEATLIDFIQKHVMEQKSVASLKPELEQVLEEDAQTILAGLWRKVTDLSK